MIDPRQKSGLVVVYNIYVVCMAITPSEDNAVLIVDSNGVKTSVVPNQLFKVIAGWNTKIEKLMG
jgi:hypothetical protein